MIRDLKALYVAIKDREVVCFGTNLSGFLRKFQEIEPDMKDYQHYRREFKKANVIPYTNSKRETYILQKVLGK